MQAQRVTRAALAFLFFLVLLVLPDTCWLSHCISETVERPRPQVQHNRLELTNTLQDESKDHSQLMPLCIVVSRGSICFFLRLQRAEVPSFGPEACANTPQPCTSRRPFDSARRMDGPKHSHLLTMGLAAHIIKASRHVPACLKVEVEDLTVFRLAGLPRCREPWKQGFGPVPADPVICCQATALSIRLWRSRTSLGLSPNPWSSGPSEQFHHKAPLQCSSYCKKLRVGVMLKWHASNCNKTHDELASHKDRRHTVLVYCNMQEAIVRKHETSGIRHRMQI